MIWRKSCGRCGKRISKDFSYCPHCGHDIKDDRKEKEDYGFLGKVDADLSENMKLPFGFNAIFKKLVKEMDKQFRGLDKEIGKTKMNKADKLNENPMIKQGGLSINISSGDRTPVIKIKSFGNMPEFREMERQAKQIQKPKIRKTKFTEEKAMKFAKLPRQEAESKVRRLSGKVIYEIELPGVKNIENIIINQLENSIEIKAFAEDRAFFKFLPISLPLLRYRLSNGKLILELGEK